jgi:hypothetical protein
MMGAHAPSSALMLAPRGGEGKIYRSGEDAKRSRNSALSVRTANISNRKAGAGGKTGRLI